MYYFFILLSVIGLAVNFSLTKIYQTKVGAGGRYNANSTLPYCLGMSDVILYHLAGFMTILEKHQATQVDTRPIVLCGITERMDEDNPLSSYLSKMKKYGRDVYVFASNNDTVTRGLFLSVREVNWHND